MPVKNIDDLKLSISQQFIEDEFEEINKRLANLESMVQDMRNMISSIHYKVRVT